MANSKNRPDGALEEAKRKREEAKGKHRPANRECEEEQPSASELEFNMPLPPGTTIGYEKGGIPVTYQIDRKIGRGGFSMTYLAHRLPKHNEMPVVIKEFFPGDNIARCMKDGDKKYQLVINPEHIALPDFRKEPERIQRLLNDIIAKAENPDCPQADWEKLNLMISLTEETFTCYGNEYYVMHYVKGQSLTEFMKKRENYDDLSVEQRLDIVGELCIAVRHLHSVDCVHQDLSSNNIMVSKEEDGTIRLKVIDYGMSTTLFHTNGRNSSHIRCGSTPGFTDTILKFREYESYFKKKKTRRKVKLIDIYSLGAILAYVCLLPYEVVSDSSMNEYLSNILSEKEGSERCGQAFDIKAEDAPYDVRAKTIHNLIRTLVLDATDPNMEKRIQSVDEFMGRLQAIVDVNKSLAAKSGPTEEELKEIQDKLQQKEQENKADKERLQKVLELKGILDGQFEKEQNLRKEQEERNRQAEEKIADLQKRIKALQETAQNKQQEYQKLLRTNQERLQKDLQQNQAYLKEELQRKDQESKADKERLQKELALKDRLLELEKSRTDEKSQELAKTIKTLSDREGEERRKRQELEEKHGQLQVQIQELTACIQSLIDKPLPPPTPPSPSVSWYVRYKKPFLIALAVLGLVGATAGIGSLDWSDSDIRTEELTAAETQPLPAEEASPAAQSAEAGINVSQELTPEQLTLLIQQAREDGTAKKRLLGLCAEDVFVLEEEEGGVTFDVPFPMLFGQVIDHYPTVGATHKVKTLEYENGKIKMIVLTRIK